MIRTEVKVTIRMRLDWTHNTAPQMPTSSVATQGILNRGCTQARALEIGIGHARSRPLEYTTRENCSVIANDALKMARIAPQVTRSTAVWPNDDRTTSVSGVLECRNAGRLLAPRLTPMKGMSSNTMPMDAAMTTARPTPDAEPSVSSEKLIAES